MRSSMRNGLPVLVDQGILTDDMFVSSFGPAPDGGPDFGVRLDSDEVTSFDARYIVGIDRTMLLQRVENIPVLFADAHVDRLTPDELREMLASPDNEGAREALQIPDDF